MGSRIFSSLNRASIVNELENDYFDVLVIGGGITGNGIALDAATRGLKIALIERKDFASGTSSRSGKLIHGGLKYLQKFDFPVVKETGRERAIVYNNARHLVYPINMNFPIIKKESYNLATLKAGLTLYDRLAGVRKEERHKIYSKRKTLKHEPLFNPKTIKGSGIYVEYRTDDSRLTLEAAKTAAEKGASILNYAEMTDFLQDEHNQVKGVVARDHVDERTFTIKAAHIVNAAGPWVDKVRQKDRPINGKYMVHAKGIHIVFSYQSLPVASSIYFQHKGRMIAVIPKDDKTYVGSTETIYNENMDDIHVHKSEVNYLLGCLHDIFPSLDLSIDDVTSSWAGIRPLIGKDDDAPSELSRHDEIFESDSGLITIAGGKLTGYRKMAERVLQYIEKRDNQKPTSSNTDHVKLSGGHFASEQDLAALVNQLHEQYSHLQLTKNVINEFVLRYGTNTEELLKQIMDYDDRFDDDELRNIAAEIRYTVEHEMAATLADFYDRRTSYLLFDLDKVKRTMNTATNEMKAALQWDEQTTKKQTAHIQYLTEKALTFAEGE
ncbi:glycerol-3-phosphate dehydrogenase [Lentibacillus halodurans]|uniref:Aerobic glycerol-3-phosphate dehydrogenase n=1 Tax=Lentibacillus halodurans TaxID=237679 RepID=A0A1I0XH65_9BACI|nr:glycerol-3-phosphate dehydrogenase/oxidase [Lentibacillus halodurans]SFB00254.1 glycerol-3-phosphate dehydrogenase [Lentibacillus halodurans]